MRLGTALKVSAVLVAAAVVGLIAAVKSIDIDEYRSLALEKVREATGRELAIRGKFELALSLSPALVAEDVVFANAPSGTRSEMAIVKRIEAEVGLLPLLTGTVEVRRLVLVEPDILLELDEKGVPNWQFAGATESAAATEGNGGVPNLRIGKVRLEKVKVTWRDGRDGRLLIGSIESLAADGTKPSAPIAITAAGKVDGRQVDVSGVVGPLSQLLRQTEPYPVKLKGSAAGTVAIVDGRIGRLATGEGLDLKITVEGTELAEAAKFARLKIAPWGPFRMAAKLSGSAANPALGEIEAAVGKRDLLLVSAKGAIKALRPVEGIDLALTVESDKPAALSGIAGTAIPPAAAMKLAGQLSDGNGEYRLTGIKGSLGKSDVAGEATVRLGQPRPSITARLTSTLLDVADVDPALVRAPRSEGAKTAPPPAAAPGAKADDRLIPDLPVDTDALTRADLDLEWKIRRLALGEAAADDVEARLELRDGRLVLKPLSARVGDGRLDGELAIDGTGRPATMRLGLVADGIEAGALLKNLRLTEAVSGAKTALRLDLQAKGGSLRGLLARTDGDVTLIVDSGVIGNAYVDLLAFDLIRAIAPWTPREDMTRMQCLVARFAIRNGLAKSQALLFDTSHMTMGGSGTVNLASEGLDLTLVPRAKQASLVNLAIPMDVGGTFAHPTILPNKAALAIGVAGAAAGAAIMPLGVLVPLITTGLGDANPCVEALAQATGKAPADGAARKLAPEAVIQGIGEGIGGLLKGITGR